MKPVIIIPVYNHGQQVGEVVRQARKLELPLILVNDGSTDSTRVILDAMDDVVVLHHPVNQGKGAAILTGFSAAMEKQYDWALTLDADGQHNPEDARELLTGANHTDRCLVVGKRLGMAGNDNVPWTSRFGRGFSNFWVWVSGGPLVEDSQSGFRLYPLPEALELGVKARRYQFEVEILVKARQQGIAIKEIPVQVIYQPKGERVSHFRPWLDFWRNSTTFSRLIFDRIFGAFHR